jgi:20S proteasome alpha/beta subunit
LTCIIGARGADGCVIISDTREISDYEVKDVSKIRLLWDGKAALVGAGDARLLDKLTESLPTLPIFPLHETIEDTVNVVRKRYAERIESATGQYRLAVIFMGPQGLNGDPYIHMIYGDGVSNNIRDFEIIGHGSKYIKVLFKLLYNERLHVNELAVLGFFCIESLFSTGLDQTVGTGQLGPQIVVYKKNDRPNSLNPQDCDFTTARNSSRSRDFRYKLVKSVWNQIPQAFEKVDKNLL